MNGKVEIFKFKKFSLFLSDKSVKVVDGSIEPDKSVLYHSLQMTRLNLDDALPQMYAFLCILYL